MHKRQAVDMCILALLSTMNLSILLSITPDHAERRFAMPMFGTAFASRPLSKKAPSITPHVF